MLIFRNFLKYKNIKYILIYSTIFFIKYLTASEHHYKEQITTNTWYSFTQISNLLDSKNLFIHTATSLQLYDIGFSFETACIPTPNKFSCPYIKAGLSHKQTPNQNITYEISHNQQNKITTANITYLYTYQQANKLAILGVHFLSLKQSIAFYYNARTQTLNTYATHQVRFQFIQTAWFTSNIFFSIGWNQKFQEFPTILTAGISFFSIFYVDVGIKDDQFLQAKNLFLSSWLSYNFYNSKISLHGTYIFEELKNKKSSIVISLHAKYSWNQQKNKQEHTKKFSKIHSTQIQISPPKNISNLRNPSPKIDFFLYVLDKPIEKQKWSIYVYDDTNNTSKIIYQITKTSIPPTKITWKPFSIDTEQIPILKSYTKYRVVFHITSNKQNITSSSFFETSLIQKNDDVNLKKCSLFQLYTDPLLFISNQKNLTKKSETLLEKISFDLNHTSLTYKYIVLNGYVHPVKNIHNAQFGYTLSKKRAEEVAHYLQKSGITSEKIQTRGYGSLHKIIHKNANKNRNVDIFLVEEKTHKRSKSYQNKKNKTTCTDFVVQNQQ